MKKFPKEWPDDCPPKDSIDADGVFYRVGKRSSPSIDDFKSHEEMDKKTGGDKCMRRGLSVFSNHEDARHITKIFPMLGAYVYCGNLQPEHGKIKPTPSNKNPSHTTWWPYTSIDRASLFRKKRGN